VTDQPTLTPSEQNPTSLITFALFFCYRTEPHGSVRSRVRTPPRGSDSQEYGLVPVFKKIPVGFCPVAAKMAVMTWGFLSRVDHLPCLKRGAYTPSPKANDATLPHFISLPPSFSLFCSFQTGDLGSVNSSPAGQPPPPMIFEHF